MNTTLPTERRTDTPRRVIRALFEFRWAMLGFFLAFFVFLMLIAYNFPPIWEGTAQVLVKSGRPNAPTDVAVVNPQARLDTTLEDVVSEMTIMRSEPVLRQVADRLRAPGEGEEKEATFISRLRDGFDEFATKIGLLWPVEEGANLVDQLSRKITVEIEPGAHVINIAYTNFSRKAAVNTVNYLLDAYLDQHAKIHALGNALPFFEEQATQKKAELDALQQQITDFRLSHDGGDLAQQRGILVQELITSEQDLNSLQGVDESAEGLLRSPSLAEHPELASLHQQLLALDLEISRLTGVNPTAVETARKQIPLVRASLLEQLHSKRSLLEKRVTDLRGQIQVVERDRAFFEDLLTHRDEVASSHRQYAAKVEEERISQAMDESQLTNVRVLARAVPPVKPWFPNRFVMAMLGFFLGIPGAIAFALLRAYFHGRVSTVQDIEKELGLPVLTSLPRLPASAFSEQMPESVQKAARMVLASIDQAGARSVCLASATAGEGAATLAAAVAQAAAADHRRVVFATPDGNVSPAIAAAGVSILDLSGKGNADQRRLVHQAAAEADLVVMAALPLASAEGGLYASSADAAILVVSGSGVHIEVARRGYSVLERYCPKILGAVLTQRKDPIPRALYRRV